MINSRGFALSSALALLWLGCSTPSTDADTEDPTGGSGGSAAPTTGAGGTSTSMAGGSVGSGGGGVGGTAVSVPPNGTPVEVVPGVMTTLPAVSAGLTNLVGSRDGRQRLADVRSGRWRDGLPRLSAAEGYRHRREDRSPDDQERYLPLRGHDGENHRSARTTARRSHRPTTSFRRWRRAPCKVTRARWTRRRSGMCTPRLAMVSFRCGHWEIRHTRPMRSVCGPATKPRGSRSTLHRRPITTCWSRKAGATTASSSTFRRKQALPPSRSTPRRASPTARDFTGSSTSRAPRSRPRAPASLRPRPTSSS